MPQEVLSLDDRTIAQAVRAARALPNDLRQEFRRSVNREVVAPVAREVQAVAGRSAIKPVRAFRNKGVAVKPGEEPTLVVGGPESYGRTRMRTIAFGAEFGGSSARETYSRRGRKVGRKRSGSHQVTRRVTTEFGTKHDNDGRFVYPTLRKAVPQMTEAFLGIVERVTEEVWTRGK